jgi:hypothetical protein
MGNNLNFEIAISDPEYIDNEAFWNIYDFGVGKRLAPEDWKNEHSNLKDTASIRKALAASHNTVSFAMDVIDFSNPVNRNFPKLTAGKHYDQILVRVNSFHSGLYHSNTKGFEVAADGHSNDLKLEYDGNYGKALITLYHVSIQQAKVVPIPKDGLLQGPKVGTFSCAVCKVAAARIR